MAQVTLLPQTGSVNTGTSVKIGTIVDKVNIQFTPQANLGFSGTVLIEGSTAPSPGNDDWFTLVTVALTNHTSVVNFNLFLSNNPWVRARTPAAGTLGSVSVYMAY